MASGCLSDTNPNLGFFDLAWVFVLQSYSALVVSGVVSVLWNVARLYQHCCRFLFLTIEMKFNIRKVHGYFVTSAYSSLAFVCSSVRSNVGKLVSVTGCITRSLLTEHCKFEMLLHRVRKISM